jgi:hypothetical protein
VASHVDRTIVGTAGHDATSLSAESAPRYDGKPQTRYAEGSSTVTNGATDELLSASLWCDSAQIRDVSVHANHTNKASQRT